MTTTSHRQKFGLIIGIIFGILVVTYGFFQAKVVLLGVNLKIEGISDGGIYTSPLINIKGVAKYASSLAINGEQIQIDTSGAFNNAIIIPPGFSVVTTEAKDKFGHIDTKKMRVYYKT